MTLPSGPATLATATEFGRRQIQCGTDTRDNMAHVLAWYGCRLAGIPTIELTEAMRDYLNAAEHEGIAARETERIREQICGAA